MPVRVAEHAARAGYGVELFRITGEKDLRATHFCEPGYPLQVSAVDHAGLVHDDQLVGFDRVRRVRDMVGSDVDAGESRSNGLDAFLNCCWSLPSCWISALIRSGSLRAISMAMVLLSQPMLLRSSSTALWLVARPRTLPAPYRACHASATAFMVVVFPCRPVR